MLSTYLVILISCIIFWCTYLWCFKKEIPQYSGAELVLFYILARIVPFYSMENRNGQNLLCLSAEWVMMGLLYYYTSRRKPARMQSAIMAFYLFQPGTTCCIMAGSLKGMYISVSVLAALCVLDSILEKQNRSLVSFLPEYLIGNAGIFFWFIATRIFGQRFSQIAQTTEIPVCYILSLAVMGVTFVAICLKLADTHLCSGTMCEKQETDAESPIPNAENLSDSENAVYAENVVDVKNTPDAGNTADAGTTSNAEKTVKGKLFGRDFVLMALLTLAFAVAVFWKLGSHYVPETYESFQVGETGENEIVLQFAEEVTLSKVSVFLGYQGKRILSFSEQTRDNAQWVLFDSNHSVDSAFAWNTIDINRTLHSLGIVLMEGSARINEIVCLDAEGNVILPVNAQDYPRLFDEQQLWVENPTYYDQTMFDEVYHGRTAYEFLYGLPIYENSHPPLGKSIISVGIALFGMNPFGWRFMCALFGVLLIPLTYLFAHKLFARTELSCFATILTGTAFMNTTLSRIATIDILVCFFVILMFYFMYGYVDSLNKNKGFGEQTLWLFFCGIAMALAVSTKWTGFYGAFGIAIMFFYFLFRKIGGVGNIKSAKGYLIKTFLLCVVFFILIPAVIYTLSYIPFVIAYPDKGLIAHMVDNASLMLDYHSDCVFDHPYSSEWYEWLIDARPLADSRTYFEDGTVRAVLTFLNPLLCFGGLAAVVFQFFLWRKQQCKKALFLIMAYLSMLMPWLFVHRTVFIYQYLISAMLLPLMAANAIQYTRHPKRNMIIVAVISTVLYVLYYPVLTGQPVSVDRVNGFLEIFERWNIA